MSVFFKIIALLALVAVGGFYFTFVLILFACLLGVTCVVVTIWWINGTPIYLTKNGERVLCIRRFKITRLRIVNQ